MAELRISGGFSLDTDRFEDEGLRVGIFASPGAGKGYLFGVLMEELIDAGYPCVMVDPESELWTFREVGALVLGGDHGHVPLGPGSGAVIEEALRFCLDTATPVVFDLGGFETDPEIRGAFEAVAAPYWRLVSESRKPSVFGVTEAHVIAPQAIPRGEAIASTLPKILTRGRKRGASVLLETQRIADIANSVISHCNVRFIGRIDFEDDFKRVAKGLPGVSVGAIQSLERGTFYVPRIAEGPVAVRARRVTHGAVTPGAGEVELRREEAPGAVAEIAARLAALAVPPEPAPDTRMAVRDQALSVVQEIKAEVEKVKQQLAVSEQRGAEAVRMRLEAESRARKAESALASAERLRAALIDFVGTVEGGSSNGAGYPGDEHVLGLIREHAPAGGGAVAVQPVAKLRAGYLERTAQRLVQTVKDLTADERDALLYLVSRDGAWVSVNAISLALSGNDSGGSRNRWSKATNDLKAKGLVVIGGSGRMGRRENIEAFVASGLAPHEPTADELAKVRDRALYVLQGES